MKPSTSSDQASDTKSTNSNLQDALESSLSLPQAARSPESASPPAPDRANDLVEALEQLQTVHRGSYSQRLAIVSALQHIVQSDPDARNAFAAHGGFLTAVSVLASLDEAVSSGGGPDTDSPETRAELRYELVSVAFNLIATAYDGHDLNRATFLESVGFDAVGEAIKLSQLMEPQPAAEDAPESAPPAERLLSILYSFLINDFISPPLFTTVRQHLAEPLPPTDPVEEDGASPPPPPSREERISAFLRNRSDDLFGADREVAENSEVVPLMLELEASLGEDQPELRFAVLAALLQLATSSRRSQVALNTAGVVGIALERLHPPPALAGGVTDGPAAKAVLRKLTENLLEMGAGTKETRKMFQSVVEGWESPTEGQERLNDDMLSLILDGVRNSRYPSFIHFDLSRHGYSALTLRSLGRQFPPPTHGYTYLAWLSIEHGPSAADERLIVFGCGDATGRCHVEVSITPDLRLALATSLNKPPVVFAGFKFETGKFYHLAVVHQRPKYSSNSPVTLYIDGKLVEVSKAPYPVAPPKEWEVQGWLGTPKDRVPNGRLGKGKSQLKWDLGPTWLIHGDVPEEMINVCSTLSPRYACNFQDQLGQFQTNATSTQLNLRIDEATRNLPKGAASNSPLIYAIRDKGSAHRILFAFTALNVLVAGSGRGLSSSGLSVQGQQTLSLATRGRGKCIINSAIPHVEEAIVQPHGLAMLEGEPCIANPQGLDVAIWKIGGVAVALRLVELASTSEQLKQAIQLFVELVSESWRNSEDTERVQGYEILALHLRAKPGLISAETHDVLLAFVGFDFVIPAKSVVSNPLAFRFLVLDFGLWGLTDPAVQRAHCDRLREFVERSQHKEFNTRRLSKMHITRKLLYALRAGSFDPSMLGEVVGLLLLVVRAHFTTESVRHIATFLTATLCQVAAPALGSTPPITAVDPSTSFVLDASAVEVGASRAPLEVLVGLHNLLLGPDSDSELAKFAKVITAKWSLLFLLDKTAHPFAAVLSLRILVRLLQSQGNAFVSKFSNSLDGFSIMRAAIPHLWQYGQVHLALFSLLHGHDITTIPLDAPFASATFALSATEVSPVAPEIVRIVIAALGRGVKSLPASIDGAAEAKVPVVAVTSPGATTSAQDEPASPYTSLPLAIGFEALLDLLSQTSRAVGTAQHLVDAPVPLQDLALITIPFIRIPNASDDSSSGSTSLLPILSAQSGFRAPSAAPAQVPAPSSPTNSKPSSPVKLKLAIPDHLTSTDVLASPVIGGEDDAGSFAPAPTHLSAAASSVIKFLGQQIAHQITSRHVHRHTGSGIDPSSSPATDPCLHILRQTFASAAPGDVGEQVAFRTLIFGDVFRRLSRAGTAPLVSGRVASLVAFSADQSFEGWNTDLEALLEFGLGYLEKLLDDAVLASPSPHSRSLEGLFRSLNRVILLALYQERAQSKKVLKLLVRHQLSVFSSLNTDAEFIRCLVQRLDAMLRHSNSSEEVPDIVDSFKLLILQRPTEMEIALVQRRQHAAEAPILEKLIDTDYADFVLLLNTHRDQLDALHESWDAFVEDEGLRAKRAVESELSRLGDLSRAAKIKRDQVRRRTRKQRGSIYEWSEGIHEVEATRVAHTRQDIADLASFIQTEWHDQIRNLQRECAIWGGSVNDRQWRLDFTEGHNRMRKKLQPVAAKKPEQSRNPGSQSKSSANHSRSLGATRQDSYAGSKGLQIDGGASPIGSPITPREENMWGESFSQSLGGLSEEPATTELDPTDGYEDKNRKVRRSLEPGDVIKSVFNVNRIVGLDACPGLLLLAKKNVYIIDSFFQQANGTLVDAWDAPAGERDQHLQTLADLAGRDSKKAVSDLDTAHRSRRWTWSDVIEVHERKYLFRDVGLELFFADGRSFLLTFSHDQRSRAYGLLAEYAPSAVAFGSLNVTGSSFGSKMQDVMLGQRTKLDRMTKRWEKREVSNFEYLMFLNTSAGRTYNDLTNYPVFPWILADYSSEILDLTSDATFRDLSKPMGGEFEDRYVQLQELDDGTPPFHYGTHYSSAMITVSYLLRLRPFTESYLDLQGGSFDHADRMFWSIPKAWESASKQSRSDVRELIPEFFFLPDFLLNSNKLELGIRQESGSGIDDVELPPWAKGDPRLFVEKHRQALESEYVSQHLGEWIDLIFGYRQTGEPAVESCNVFHHLSYEGAIDLDTIVDADERKAATSTIHNFGMTPRQLFNKPHPLRVAPLVAKATHPLFSPNLLVEQQATTLIQSIVPVYEMAQQVSAIYTVPGAPEKAVATPTQSLFIPDGSHSHIISWGFSDATVRLYAKNNSLPTSLFENMHSEFDDRTAIIWDLNRHRLVHCLEGHDSRVHLVVISDTTGDIVTCSGAVVRLWTVNGVLLATQSTSKFTDVITAVAISQSETHALVATGHRNGKIMLWERIPSSEATGFSLRLVHTLRYKDRFDPQVQPDITSLVFTSRALYVGDALGKVWYFAPPGTELFLPDSSGNGSCMSCFSKFSLLEARRRCSSCSGIFCSLCTTTSVECGGRFCATCFSALSPLMVV
ncbi:hypothetical protein RQP46_001074 [Phenoliferia psychrophenolica]